jgi:HAMP domain-containing protein
MLDLAIAASSRSRLSFLRASDTGLVRLDRLSIAAQDLDKLGEQLASQAFAQVERENRSAALTLTAVLAGIVLVGAALAYTTVRILRMLQDLYAAQQQVAHDLGRSLQEKLPDTENAVNAAAQDTPAQ